jgi:hypothetical protein
MKTVRFHHRGRLFAEYQQPDWRAQTAVAWLYLKATGIIDLPP